jgi:hypothetical protein
VHVRAEAGTVKELVKLLGQLVPTGGDSPIRLGKAVRDALLRIVDSAGIKEGNVHLLRPDGNVDARNSDVMACIDDGRLEVRVLPDGHPAAAGTCGAALGVFSTAVIKKRQHVACFRGLAVPESDADQSGHDLYSVAVPTGFVLLASPLEGVAALVNDAVGSHRPPNCEIVTYVGRRDGEPVLSVRLVAKRDIGHGDELTLSYGDATYWTALLDGAATRARASKRYARVADERLSAVREALSKSKKQQQLGPKTYFIDRIMGEKVVDGTRYCLIKWCGYRQKTWEPEHVLLETHTEEELDLLGRGRAPSQ